MRYSFVGLILAGLTSTFALAASAPSMDQLAATKHNFRNPASPFNSLLGQDASGAKLTTCQPCHTPHHAWVDGNVSERLWNHEMSGATYVLYEGDSHAWTGNTDGSQGMDRVSRLCLGCHDGTVALDAFGMDSSGSRSQGTTKFLASNVNNLGTNFQDDHPVGVDAQAATATGAPAGRLKTPTISYNGTMNDPSGALNPDGTPKQVPDPNSGIKSVAFPVANEPYTTTLGVSTITGSTGYYVACRTCHNPHGKGPAPLQPYSKLLNCAPENLCTSCHYK